MTANQVIALTQRLHRDVPAMTAAGRMLAVLGAFEPGHDSLSLSVISRRAGMALSTTHRLVGELTAWGALERERSGNYRIGLRLLELAALAPRGLELRETAQPYLDDLHHATRANVHLGVRDGHEVVYAEALRARGAVHVLSRLGGRWPLTATGTGLVLLAFAEPALQEEVLSAPFVKFTPKTITDPHLLRRMLAEVRQRKLAMVKDQITLNGHAIAAPVYGPDDTVLAAVGLVISVDEDERGVIPALTATTRALSRALGAPLSFRAAQRRQLR